MICLQAPVVQNSTKGTFDDDKCIPVVDKIVDAAWAKTVPIKELALEKGMSHNVIHTNNSIQYSSIIYLNDSGRLHSVCYLIP